MGVATIVRQYNYNINLMTPWWLSGASVDLDLDSNRYYDSSLAVGVQSLAQLPDYLSCTRASTGYAKTAAGTLTSFVSNQLRRTDLGLLVEDARTNVETFSQAINDTNWSTDGSTLTTYTLNATVAPDGTTTMSQMFDSTGNGGHRVYKGFASGYTTWTASIYIKDVDRRYVALDVQNGATSDQARMVVDLQTGSVTDTRTAGSATITSATTEALANNTWRIILSGTVTTGAHYFQVALMNGSTAGSDFYTGSNKSIYVWGAQLETSTYATSYIPTTGTSATRAADAVTVTGALNSLLTTLPQSFVLDTTTPAGAIAQNHCALLCDSGDGIPGLIVSGGNPIGGVWSGASFTTGPSISLSVGSYSTGAKSGLAQSSGAISVVGNGGSVASDAINQTVFPSGARLGTSVGINSVGLIRRATFWNSKLADAALQALTAP